MSTEINLEELYNNSVKILTDLIGFRTISGEDNSALINYCDDYLHKLGATSFKTFDEDKKRVNLFATLKAKKLTELNQLFYQDIQIQCQFQKVGAQIHLKQLLKVTSFMVEVRAI